MSRERVMNEWDCGLCFEEIGARSHVRIAVDAAAERDLGGVESLMDDEVLIMAVFHTKCLAETEDDDGLADEVPYLGDARALVEVLRSRKVENPTRSSAKSSSRHLQVLNGGVR